MPSRRRAAVEAEIAKLKWRLQGLEEELSILPSESEAQSDLPMELIEYQRYGRQMILDGLGLEGTWHWRALDLFFSLNMH
jgi:hypothetical protein